MLFDVALKRGERVTGSGHDGLFEADSIIGCRFVDQVGSLLIV